MRQVELVLRAVLADVCEQRLALEEAVEKICADPSLREALFLDLRKMAIRRQEQEEFLSIRKQAGLKIDPATAKVIRQYVPIGDPYGIYGPPMSASALCCLLAPPTAMSGYRRMNYPARLRMPSR